MKTQTKIIYGTILGLAAAAFAVDRFVIGTDEQNATSENAIAHAADKSAAASGATKTVAARLQDAVVAAATPRDAFSLPAKWMSEAKAATSAPARDLAADFHQHHKLNAVLRGEEGGVAIIDGKALRVGQTIDGFTVRSIGQRAVSLAGEGTTVEVRLARPLAATVATIR